MTVDVVGENGAKWIKVIARNPKALDLNSSGGNQFGQKSFMDQVSEFLACAAQNVKLFRPPTVVFVFHSGVSQRLADRIRRKGAVVEGEVVPSDNPAGYFSESSTDDELSEAESEDLGSDDDHLGRQPLYNFFARSTLQSNPSLQQNLTTLSTAPRRLWTVIQLD